MNEGRRGEKIGYRGNCGGTDVPLQAQAVPNSLENLAWQGYGTGMVVPPQARVVPLLLVNDFKFFSFFRIIFGQIPTKKIKTTQNKQNKSN